jgi:hypothetical protein
MHAIAHTTLPRVRDAGRESFSAANRDLGITAFEIWVEYLAAGAQLTLEDHGGDRVGLVMSGFGKLLVDGAPQRFHAPCTLILPTGSECKVVNTGAEVMHLVVTLACREERPRWPVAGE